jgi:hypothetical protein
MDIDSRPKSSIPDRNLFARSGGNVVQECRRGVRIPYHSAVEFNTPTGPFSGTIRNISIGGLFVDTKTLLSVSQKFEMNFQFRSGKYTMKLLAQVVRKTSEGLGIKLL